MSTRSTWSVLTVIITLVMGAMVQTAAAQDDVQYARISFDSGGGMVKGSDDEEWSYATTNTLILPGDTLWVDEEDQLEAELPGGTFLRMADGTKAEMTSLPPSALIRGWTGAFYVQRVARSNGKTVFETPACSTEIGSDSDVRIDILADGATTLTVRWGQVYIKSLNSSDATTVGTGQRVFVDPGFLPSDPVPFDRNAEDSFDAWNRERAEQLAKAVKTIPAEIKTTAATVGMTDLAPYGEWVTVNNANYWRPTAVVDYVPYRTGHWSFVPGCGYVWVGDYPFCYVTSHYGRWFHDDTYGWLWTYRDAWSPAWAATVQYGDNFVWAPLDPWDRPVSFGAETFLVGGVSFGVFGSTFCSVDDLMLGGCYVRPLTPVIIQQVPIIQINIWNIYIGGNDDHHGDRDRHHAHWSHDDSMVVRDFTPRRHVRGLDIEGHHDGERAHARVASLEHKEGRPDFRTGGHEEHKNERTSLSNQQHDTRLRSVKADPKASDVDNVRKHVTETTKRTASEHEKRREGRPGMDKMAGDKPDTAKPETTKPETKKPDVQDKRDTKDLNKVTGRQADRGAKDRGRNVRVDEAENVPDGAKPGEAVKETTKDSRRGDTVRSKEESKGQDSRHTTPTTGSDRKQPAGSQDRGDASKPMRTPSRDDSGKVGTPPQQREVLRNTDKPRENRPAKPAESTGPQRTPSRERAPGRTPVQDRPSYNSPSSRPPSAVPESSPVRETPRVNRVQTRTEPAQAPEQPRAREPRVVDRPTPPAQAQIESPRTAPEPRSYRPTPEPAPQVETPQAPRRAERPSAPVPDRKPETVPATPPPAAAPPDPEPKHNPSADRSPGGPDNNRGRDRGTDRGISRTEDRRAR